MTKIPPDDILEGLYKLRIRESEKLKTVLELYDLEIHQKLGPDYHRSKTMVKRNIEQNLRIKNYKARNGNYETNAVDKNHGTKQCEQRTPKDCWQWKANGQCSKGDNWSSDTLWISVQNRHSRMRLRDLPRGRMWEMHREPEVLEAEPQVEECLDCRARIASKELPPLHSVKIGILQNSFSTSQKMDADLGKSALMRIARLMTSRLKDPKESWHKCSGYIEEYTTIGLRISGYGVAEVFIDFAEELKHTAANPMCSIHQIRVTSRQRSRPKSIAWNDLPRWSSSA